MNININTNNNMSKWKNVTTFVFLLQCVCFFGISFQAVEIEEVAKPSDSLPEKRKRSLPAIPAEYTELPFVETAPVPVANVAELNRGFMLFNRPITVPVYENTVPLAHERLERLSAFATSGEIESLTLSVYPLRDLSNMKVRVSELRSADGLIPENAIDLRLGTYIHTNYPKYHSETTYRRLPEFLEDVTVDDALRFACRRWWIQVRVPEDAVAGLYTGTVTLWDDGYGQAIAIPLTLRVLGFSLQADPNKSYSAYLNLKNRHQYDSKNNAETRIALDNEYASMHDLGLNMLPTMFLDLVDGKIVIRHEEEIAYMLAAGLRGPLPLAGGLAIGQIYRDTTPGGVRGSHWAVNPLPEDIFYQRVHELFIEFKESLSGKGYPEVICVPVDEVASTHADFGSRVCAAIKTAGVRVYITKDPHVADARAYDGKVDVWCSQAFSASYGEVVGQNAYEYWCYPNKIAGESKNRNIMCQGGRMTYGFGFWRSAYTTLIPWHWAWVTGADQFDYLLYDRSGTGQRLDENGNVITTIYWQCFREGIDDARYLYTLQQAIFQRQNSANTQCQQAVAEAQKLVQDIWDSIHVKQFYTADDLWAPEEFQARRWQIAVAVTHLLDYPATQGGNAPSVLLERTDVPQGNQNDSIADEIAKGNIVVNDLSSDFSRWVAQGPSGVLTLTTDAGKDGNIGMHWQVLVDHDPIGWPRLRGIYDDAPLDLTNYDILQYEIRIDSDRDEVADDSTPVGFTIHSNKFFEVTHDMGDVQREWITQRFYIQKIIDSVGQGDSQWKRVDFLQIFLSEKDYNDNTQMTIDVASVKLLRFVNPVVTEISLSQVVILPRPRIAVPYMLLGYDSSVHVGYTIVARFEDANGQSIQSTTVDLADNQTVLELDASAIKGGVYTLILEVQDDSDVVRSSLSRNVNFVQGPMDQEPPVLSGRTWAIDGRAGTQVKKIRVNSVEVIPDAEGMWSLTFPLYTGQQTYQVLITSEIDGVESIETRSITVDGPKPVVPN